MDVDQVAVRRAKPIAAVRRLALAACMFALATVGLRAQIRLADETDRATFRAWFTFLADAQFYRPTTDVTDCAGLVRYATRESVKTHSPEWHRLARLPLTPPFADLRTRLQPTPAGWPLFRVDDQRYSEFADARTIISRNARPLGRDIGALRPGDLLYFRQDAQRSPDHIMVFVGPSLFDHDGADWIVYHTGPTDTGPGEVRKVRLTDLQRHPAARWRPLAHNPSFVGIFRLAWL
jgi:uncharacterized protein YfaT (DUF1175 family)